MTKRILLTLLAAFFNLTGQAQLINEQQLSRENFLKRVTSIESFMARFNAEEDQRGNQIGSGNKKTPDKLIKDRTYSILSLFNIESANKAEGEEKNNIISFVKQVNNDTSQIKLDFYDSDWYAEIECQAEYKKQRKIVTLILKNQKVNTSGSKWVIQSAYADFLHVKPTANEQATYIPPNSHGTDFIGVPDVSKDVKNISLYTASDYRPDAFSMFLFAVYNQDLILHETTKVSFHILQIDGWILQVKEFNRDSSNAGWLIDKLVKANDSTKIKYRKNLFTGDKI